MNTGLGNALLQQAQAYSAAEAAAVVLAVLYLLLAIRQNIWCWFCAALSTALFAWLFFAARLYMESVLNVFYFGMAIYGWQSWYAGRSDAQELPVSSWPQRVHARAIVMVFALSGASGFILQQHTDAAFPYVDSLTSWGAVWATFLVARKVLQNWWYWLLIDAALVYVFWARELELTALLYAVYLAMIPFGLFNWTRSWRESRA